MKNKDEIKEIIGSIKEETDPLEAIRTLANTTYEIGVEACEERERLSKRIDNLSLEIVRLRKILCGNGDPSSSLLSRMDRLEDAVEKIGRAIETIKNRLVGDLDSNQPSMNQRILDVEKVSSNVVKVTWILIALLIGEFFAQLFGLF